MANWHLVEHAGVTLVNLVQRRLDQIGLPGVTVGLVTTASFKTLATTGSPFVSIFLYQIHHSTEQRNLRQSALPDGSRTRQPLPLELCYLITAWGVRSQNDVTSDGIAAQEEARLLGVVMQALYENAEVSRGDLFEATSTPVWGPNDGLQILMESLPIESHYRIWDASELGYRLSLVYRMRCASLDVPIETPGPAVVDSEVGISA